MTARSAVDRCVTLPVVQALAVDVSLAALLGEGLYNFGELLLHPIVSSLSQYNVGSRIFSLKEF